MESTIFEEIFHLIDNNIRYFDADESDLGLRFSGAFVGINYHLLSLKNLVLEVEKFAANYDFEDTKGNGFSSFLHVTEMALKHSLKTTKYITENRDTLLFRKQIYSREIEACHHLIASLCTFLTHLIQQHNDCEYGNLFVKGEHTPEEILATANSINNYCFYGRALGFQYADSIKPIMKFIAICMASFSESYYSNGNALFKATSSMFTSGKYLMDPEARSRRIVNISQNSSADFCKSFWFLAESELMQMMPAIVGSSVKINKILVIPAETLTIKSSKNDEEINIPVPFSHLGVGPVQARLISSHRRVGMMGERKNSSKSDTLPASKCLILHAHGGGFVAQSSKSHEIYLREWAVELNVPILSIDYSLAPDAAYPRALEEVFYAYCWALKNKSLLGTTCERIVFAGDSAGANLCLATILKCIDYKIRVPDGVFIAYCPVLVNFNPSPSRLLCLMDPLLPFGFMMRCLKAYACPSPEVLEANQLKLLGLYEIKQATLELNGAKNFNEREIISPEDSKVCVECIGSENSDSFEEISVWERDNNRTDSNLLAHISPLMSDATNDTLHSLAGNSFLTQTANNNNIDIVSPIESNNSIAASLEDDSLPITIHNMPYSNSDDNKDPFRDIDLPAQVENKEYVAEFIEKYVYDAGIEKDGLVQPLMKISSRSPSEENIVFDIGKEAISVNNIQNKFQKMFDAVSSTFTQMTTTNRPIISRNYSSDDATTLREEFDGSVPISPKDEFNFTVPEDPFMSPYCASNEVLKQFPPVKILSLVLDPFLDDSIMFAKRLKSVKVNVGLDILSGLPHGFLNFSTMSKEANDGSKLCMKRISELLDVKIDEDETKLRYCF